MLDSMNTYITVSKQALTDQKGHVARRHLYNRSAMPLELPGMD